MGMADREAADVRSWGSQSQYTGAPGGEDGALGCEAFGKSLRLGLELEGRAVALAAGRAPEQDEEVIGISVALCLKDAGLEAAERSPTSSH